TGCERNIKYPPTETKVVVDTFHGTVVEDSYRWLEEQYSPETRAWIEAQNRFLASFREKFPGLDKIRTRLLELNKVDVVRLPSEAGGKYFYRARSSDEELYSICMREGLDGPERRLVDPKELDENLSQSVEIMSLSLDGGMLAYSIRESGEDEVVIKFLNVMTGEYLDDVFPRAAYFGLDIDRDASGCFYTRMDSLGNRVYYHQFGAPMTDDKMIFGKDYSNEKFISSSLSEDKTYLMLTVYYGAGGHKTEVWLKDVGRDHPVKPVVTDINAQFYPSIAGNKLYLLTNWEAPNRRVLVTDVTKPEQKNWQEVIPESKFAIESFSPTGGWLFVGYLENVTSRIRIFSLDGKADGELELPALGSASGVYGNWKGNNAFYSFSSYVYPDICYRYDIENKTSSLWSERKVPINTDNIKVEQVWYDSRDGTKVPMFLVYRDGLKRDGHNPVLLYGYGGFSVNMTPSFSESFALWVEMGGVLAVPGLRGGAEFGENWHRAGMLEQKQNTFDDFYAAAQWLLDNKYTNPAKLAAMGGSNGGLLTGAAITQRPDLFKAVVCTYPLLDMLRYHKLMMGPYWIAEYGSADDSAQFPYIYKYSPYQNVTSGMKYPAVMFITGDGDTRVDPMHARKMTALLQANTGSNEPILLHYETEIGHSGGLAISKGIEQSVDWLGFICWQLGVKP
ncbi:MAG: prolyl oligopeptidase family serine peptidase, partial [Candidatus Zixiibacteriota bacterium]